MKTIFRTTTFAAVFALVATVARAQAPSAENDYRRATRAASARAAAEERALVKKLRTSIIPQFARMEGLTPVKVDTPKFWSTTSTYFSHMTTADGQACRVQVSTRWRAFQFEDAADMKSFFRPARAKVLVPLCGKARTKKFVQHNAELIAILLNYAQTYGTDHEEYYKLERLTIAGANLGLSVYQSDCQLERWTITAKCLSDHGDQFYDRDLLKSPKGILFDR